MADLEVAVRKPAGVGDEGALGRDPGVRFCPLGRGVVDLPAVLAALREVGYRGYATIEHDRVPGSGSPLDDLAESLRVLSSGGLAHASR
jgi:sugar phosphate isomerase/epimerase